MKISTLFESTLKTVNRNTDLTGVTEPVNVTGSVYLANHNFTHLPVNFGTIGGSFDCSFNELTSLGGAPSQVSRIFSCTHNNLTSITGIHKIIKSCGQIFLARNPIKDLKYIQYDLPAFEIIDKYLGKGKRGMIDCQQELIKAGFKDFAKI